MSPQSLDTFPDVDENWVHHPDGGNLELFRRGLAAFASDGRGKETRLFVVSGFEDDPDVETAKLYIQRGGWSPWSVQTCDKYAIDLILQHGTRSQAALRKCFMDKQTFWSKSLSNRRCATCLKDDADYDYEW